jgi:hypothetical protein
LFSSSIKSWLTSFDFHQYIYVQQVLTSGFHLSEHLIIVNRTVTKVLTASKWVAEILHGKRKNSSNSRPSWKENNLWFTLHCCCDMSEQQDLKTPMPWYRAEVDKKIKDSEMAI